MYSANSGFHPLDQKGREIPEKVQKKVILRHGRGCFRTERGVNNSLPKRLRKLRASAGAK